MIDTPNYHISIDYQDNSVEDPRLNVYEAVQVLCPGGDVVRFETNDPVEDYKSAIRLTQLLQRIKPGVVFLSSCVNHFTNDVAGYRWGDGDLIEVDPEDPPIVIPETERVDFDALSAEDKTSVTGLTQTLDYARQAAYEHWKVYPALRPVFNEMDGVYRRHCARFGRTPEVLFDEVHYLRERKAMGEALDAPSFGRKGVAA